MHLWEIGKFEQLQQIIHIILQLIIQLFPIVTLHDPKRLTGTGPSSGYPTTIIITMELLLSLIVFPKYFTQ